MCVGIALFLHGPDLSVFPVGKDLSVNQAAALMARFRLDRLVVVQGNELIGLPAMNDVPVRLISDLV